MASTITQRVISSHSKYDVFLSFRGEDTRTKFIDHLYAALDRTGIDVFKDDKKLERGKSITEVFKAIEESKISVVVLSKNYASSTWCLKELDKIVQCMKTSQRTVIPIFYDIDPSMVRKQTGNFQEAFVKHEEEFREDVEKVQTWRRALTEVADLCGWDSRNRREYEFVQEVVADILHKLSASTCTKFEDLEGIESRVEKLMMLIGTKMSNDVRMIGIHGMGGIGKTTLATVVFNLISHQFDGSSFLANVGEISGKVDGLVSLQKKLLSQIFLEEQVNIPEIYTGKEKICKKLQRKKVLIVLDDVVHTDQLEALAGSHTWFGSGSRIIITTRDEQLLNAHEVDKKYKAEELTPNEALRLFKKKAFKNHQPSKDFLNLSNHVVSYCCGLPLALKVLGIHFYGRTIDVWKDALKRLKSDCDETILNTLEISFNGLQNYEKKIFLDIACFFKGYNRGRVTKILDRCQCNPIIGINTLIEKSLITILENNQLWMHDLLQEMGRQIVKRESPKEPGRRSRLWKEEDIIHVLTKNTGTESVEGIMLEKKLNLSVKAKAFSKMINLRLLQINNVQLPNGMEYLSNELRLLKWHGFPLKSLPSNLLLDEVVELDLSYSCMEQLWKGAQPLKALKSIKLINCQNLIRTPHFTEVPELEEVNLEGCTKLLEIHPSLLVHNKINVLILKNCSNLMTLPCNSPMESLRILDLCGCSKLVKEEESLEELDIRGTSVRQPASIAHFFQWYLRLLNLIKRRSLDSTAFRLSSLLGCRSLRHLSFRDCNIGEGVIPSEIGELHSLMSLDLSKNNFVSLPESISGLPYLQSLILVDCRRLLFLPKVPSSTELLIVNGCVSLETSLNGFRLSNASRQLETLSALNCPKFIGCESSPFPVLKDYMSWSRCFRRKIFHIIVPGGEIPEWVHQKEGRSITIKRHPHVYKNSDLIGYVVCCVFVVHKHKPVLVPSSSHRLVFQMSSDDLKSSIPSMDILDASFEEKTGRAMAEHNWLILLSRQDYFREKSQDMCNPVKFSFGIKFGPGLEVKRCGARPIYKQDIEDLFNQPSGFTGWNLNKFPYEDFGGGSSMDYVSEYTRGFSCDKESKVAAIKYLDADPNETTPMLKDFVRFSNWDIVANITKDYNDEADNDAAESSECDNYHDNITNGFKLLDILVPELKDYIRSVSKVRSRPDNDELEPQPKRTKVEIEFCRIPR